MKFQNFALFKVCLVEKRRLVPRAANPEKKGFGRRVGDLIAIFTQGTKGNRETRLTTMTRVEKHILPNTPWLKSGIPIHIRYLGVRAIFSPPDLSTSKAERFRILGLL